MKNFTYYRGFQILGILFFALTVNDLHAADLEDEFACTGISISTFPYVESFETGLGDWTQDNTDDGNWTRRSGATPSNNTGPSGASNGNFYYYTEASSNAGDLGPNATTRLISPCIDLTGESNAIFSFDYHMFGNNSREVSIQVSSNGGSTWTTLLTRSGAQQGNSNDPWISEAINLSSYVGNTINLRVIGQTGNGFRSDLAIDNIAITTPACIDATLYTESFESGFGRWFQTNADNFDWTIGSGNTPTPGTGPSAASDGNQYAYIETSNSPTGAVARLISDCVDLTGFSSAIFEFDYHMHGSNGSLNLDISTDGNSWSNLFTRNGQQQADETSPWLTETISLNAYLGSIVYFRFSATDGISDSQQIGHCH